MNTFNYQIYAFSESALTIQVNPAISEPQIRWLYHLRNLILKKNISGARQVLVTFHELTVLYDPSSLTFEYLQEEIELLIAGEKQNPPLDSIPESQHLTIPVCYDDDMAWDKERLIKQSGMSFQDLIRRHHAREYIFYMYGFLPGFLYLGGLDPRLECPRLDSPRQKVVKGSVGIAGLQTGIYPMESPGGWNIIGRTPLNLFDFAPSSDEKTSSSIAPITVMVQPLDKITFTPIPLHRYKELEGVTVSEYQKIPKTT